MADEKACGTIKLVEPSLDYAADIWAFRAEILEKDADSEDQFAGCMSLDTSSSAEEWIEICRLRKSEETCQKAGTAVPSNMYLAVRKRNALAITLSVGNCPDRSFPRAGTISTKCTEMILSGLFMVRQRTCRITPRMIVVCLKTSASKQLAVLTQ